MGTTPWWQTAVIYQIYPRSFQDSNGDGVGDLTGIMSRLDYVADLGIDAIWISPFYPSPMADFGYDVSDYCNVDPMFGTLKDFDALINRVHELGLKLIMDFVPNHTSNQHAWFLESRSSKDNPKRDWYLWHDPCSDGMGPPERRPPNNWLSHFGGTAWTWDEKTQQFYMHSFLPLQPDLNWRNPEVRKAMYGAMRFWLDRGVDGFRMDVLWLLIKDAQYRDNPINPDWKPGTSSFGRFLPLYTANRPETHEIVAEMRTILDTYPGDRLLIGEIYLPIDELVQYYGASAPEGTETAPQDLTAAAITGPRLKGAQLPFNFHLIQTAWKAQSIACLIRDYEAALPPGAWPNWVLGNHDQMRLATRIGLEQARVAGMLLLTLRGTPTLYYGDELGMKDGVIRPDQVQDPAEKNQPGIGMGRDPERTPMVWTNSDNAGFTTGKPWLPISPDFTLYSVATEINDLRSVLSLYRSLLALRRKHAALHSGDVYGVKPTDEGNQNVLAYRRTDGVERMQVLLNLSGESQTIACPPGQVLLSTHSGQESMEFSGSVTLRPNEGLLIALDEHLAGHSPLLRKRETPK
ncbi:MAG TPA: alpha-amylase family glycosyl hydrolase [Acidobacteriaceae bacterium]|nr:alpha-amylase family glycosyl hydrolase [Acidobacteriaceae bacterium]